MLTCNNYGDRLKMNFRTLGMFCHSHMQRGILHVFRQTGVFSASCKAPGVRMVVLLKKEMPLSKIRSVKNNILHNSGLMLSC